MPLRSEIADIGRRIAVHFDAGGDPPFIVYQYTPDRRTMSRFDAKTGLRINLTLAGCGDWGERSCL